AGTSIFGAPEGPEAATRAMREMLTKGRCLGRRIVPPRGGGGRWRNVAAAGGRTRENAAESGRNPKQVPIGPSEGAGIAWPEAVPATMPTSYVRCVTVQCG